MFWRSLKTGNSILSLNCLLFSMTLMESWTNRIFIVLTEYPNAIPPETWRKCKWKSINVTALMARRTWSLTPHLFPIRHSVIDFSNSLMLTSPWQSTGCGALRQFAYQLGGNFRKWWQGRGRDRQHYLNALHTVLSTAASPHWGSSFIVTSRFYFYLIF